MSADLNSIYTAAGLTAEEILLMPCIIAETPASGGIEFCETAAFDKLFDYFAFEACEMPYGTAKARTGDPVDWILERLESLQNTRVNPS